MWYWIVMVLQCLSAGVLSPLPSLKCHCAALQFCCSAIVLQCYSAIGLQCYCAAVLWCCSVIILQCYDAAVLYTHDKHFLVWQCPSDYLDLLAAAVHLADAVWILDIELLHKVPALMPCLLTRTHTWDNFKITQTSICRKYCCNLTGGGVLEHIHRWKYF